MRILLIACFLVAATSLRAQDQDRKLLDRILKPDTTMQSAEQNKKFSADRTSVNKRAWVPTFYLQRRSSPKQYAGTRELPSQEFRTTKFAKTDDSAASVSDRKPADSAQTAVLPAARAPRTAHDANKQSNSRGYPGNRPFTGQGKSQKSLSRPTKPMTIEEVRELLNKNK